LIVAPCCAVKSQVAPASHVSVQFAEHVLAQFESQVHEPEQGWVVVVELVAAFGVLLGVEFAGSPYSTESVSRKTLHPMDNEAMAMAMAMMVSARGMMPLSRNLRRGERAFRRIPRSPYSQGTKIRGTGLTPRPVLSRTPGPR
jgi:hypothetical protein